MFGIWSRQVRVGCISSLILFSIAFAPGAIAQKAQSGQGGFGKAIVGGKYKPKRHKVTNANLEALILMLKDQVDTVEGQNEMLKAQNAMLKDQVDMVKDQNEMIKEQISNLPMDDPCAVPPTWREVIPGSQRFVPTTFVDDQGEPAAYCDRETGNVWEAVPSASFFSWGATPPDFLVWAQAHCIERVVGTNGQKGWRLPSIAELASLVDTTSTNCTPGFKCIPDGSPFQIESNVYWSTSEVAGRPTFAWQVDFSSGQVAGSLKEFEGLVWCMRGATDAEMY